VRRDGDANDCGFRRGSGDMPIKRGGGAVDPRRFDALELADRGDTLTGEIDVARRARVADRLAPGVASPIAWQIAGGRDALGRPTLAVSLEGTVPLICQRCLQAFEAPIAQRSELLLARNGTELQRLDAEAQEVLLAAAQLDAVTLVEDELLLSLPFAPRHPEGQCSAVAAGSRDNPAQPAQATTSPFARLAALKKGQQRST
jgi:uncharacterized protein